MVAKRVVGGILILFGLVFVSVGASLLVISGTIRTETESFMENAQTADAVITLIETEYNGDELNATVFVEYEYDGKKTVSLLKEYSSDMYEGQEITIYYDPNNPDSITTGMTSDILGTTFTVVGIIVVSVGLFPVLLGIIVIVNSGKKPESELGTGIE